MCSGSKWMQKCLRSPFRCKYLMTVNVKWMHGAHFLPNVGNCCCTVLKQPVSLMWNDLLSDDERLISIFSCPLLTPSLSVWRTLAQGVRHFCFYQRKRDTWNEALSKHLLWLIEFFLPSRPQGITAFWIRLLLWSGSRGTSVPLEGTLQKSPYLDRALVQK